MQKGHGQGINDTNYFISLYVHVQFKIDLATHQGEKSLCVVVVCISSGIDRRQFSGKRRKQADSIKLLVQWADERAQTHLGVSADGYQNQFTTFPWLLLRLGLYASNLLTEGSNFEASVLKVPSRGQTAAAWGAHTIKNPFGAFLCLKSQS